MNDERMRKLMDAGGSPGPTVHEETEEEREASIERYRVGEAARRLERRLAKNRERQLNSEDSDGRPQD
jgi:hypothetical protein